MTCLISAGLLALAPLPAAPHAAAAPAAPAAPAVRAAHPFGDPQTLQISREGATVRARWRAAADDLTALALALRVLGGKRTYVYKDGALVPEESDESDAVTLAGSPRLKEYLLRNIRVGVRGTDCPGKVTSTGNLATDGALLEFACPAPVASADITVTMLTDLHASYRTLASTAQGERHTYTRSAATRSWSLDRSAAGASGPGTAAWLAVAAAVAAAAAGAVVLRTRRVRARRGRSGGRRAAS
nr:hypothetical protein GCM10010200_054720 [Actinomadura rugatobispora]